MTDAMSRKTQIAMAMSVASVDVNNKCSGKSISNIFNLLLNSLRFFQSFFLLAFKVNFNLTTALR